MSKKNRALIKAAERRQKLVDWDVKRQVKGKMHQAPKPDDIHKDQRGNVTVSVPPVEVKIDQNF